VAGTGFGWRIGGHELQGVPGATTGSEVLLTTLGNVLTYTDSAVTNGQTYFYQVTATNGLGESPKSNEVSAIPNVPRRRAITHFSSRAA